MKLLKLGVQACRKSFDSAPLPSAHLKCDPGHCKRMVDCLLFFLFVTPSGLCYFEKGVGCWHLQLFGAATANPGLFSVMIHEMYRDLNAASERKCLGLTPTICVFTVSVL